MLLYRAGKAYTQASYALESDFESEIVRNHARFFGADTVYIDAKRKLDTRALGGTIPDGFLFDFSDRDNPEFYLVEIELAAHDFFSHIFPQVTRFLGFFQNPQSQQKLVEKLFAIITETPELSERFGTYLGGREIYKFLRDLIDTSQNILLVLDEDKPELPEIMDTYSDTWGKIVRVATIRKYMCEDDMIFSMHPEFSAIEYGPLTAPEDAEKTDVLYTEEFHLEGVNDAARNAYFALKDRIMRAIPGAQFNFTKYYISIKAPVNTAYIEVRRKRLNFVLFLDAESARLSLSEHAVRELSQSVQDWWTGGRGGTKPACKVVITDADNIDEVVDLYVSTLS